MTALVRAVFRVIPIKRKDHGGKNGYWYFEKQGNGAGRKDPF